MEFIKKYHPLALFIIYIAVLNFKQNSYIDGVVVTFLAAYVGLAAFIDHNKQPDIRSEVIEIMKLTKQQHDEDIKSVIYKYETDIKKLDNDIKEMKSKVASVSSLKSVGLSQQNIKF